MRPHAPFLYLLILPLLFAGCSPVPAALDQMPDAQAEKIIAQITSRVKAIPEEDDRLQRATGQNAFTPEHRMGRSMELQYIMSHLDKLKTSTSRKSAILTGLIDYLKVQIDENKRVVSIASNRPLHDKSEGRLQIDEEFLEITERLILGTASPTP